MNLDRRWLLRYLEKVRPSVFASPETRHLHLRLDDVARVDRLVTLRRHADKAEEPLSERESRHLDLCAARLCEVLRRDRGPEQDPLADEWADRFVEGYVGRLMRRP